MSYREQDAQRKAEVGLRRAQRRVHDVLVNTRRVRDQLKDGTMSERETVDAARRLERHGKELEGYGRQLAEMQAEVAEYTAVLEEIAELGGGE